MPWASLLVGLWIVGGIALATRHLRLARRFRQQLRCGNLVSDPALLAELADCRRSLGMARAVALLETGAVGSPALVGILRPTILLPVGMLAQLSRDERHCLFMHELAHVKRWDLIFDALAGLCQVVHWFNPAVHIAANRLRKTRELACDADVLATGGASGWGRLYSRTLLKLATRGVVQQTMPLLAGMAERSSGIEARLTSIQRYRPPTWRGHAWGVCVVAVVAGIGLSKAGEPTSKPVPEGAPAPVPVAAAVEDGDEMVTMVSHSMYYAEVEGDSPAAVRALLATIIPKGMKQIDCEGEAGARIGVASAADTRRIIASLAKVKSNGGRLFEGQDNSVEDGSLITLELEPRPWVPFGWTRLDENGRPNPVKDRDGQPKAMPMYRNMPNDGLVVDLRPKVSADGRNTDMNVNVQLVVQTGSETVTMKDAQDPMTDLTVPMPVLAKPTSEGHVSIPIGASLCLSGAVVSKETYRPGTRGYVLLATPSVRPVPRSSRPAKTEVTKTEGEATPVVTLGCYIGEVWGETSEAVQAQLDKVVLPGWEMGSGAGAEGGLDMGVVSAENVERVLRNADKMKLGLSPFPESRVMDGQSATFRRGTDLEYTNRATRLDENGRPNPKRDKDGKPALTALSTKTLELGSKMTLTPHVLADGEAVSLGLEIRIRDLIGWKVAKLKDGRDPRQELMLEIPQSSEYYIGTGLHVPVGGGVYYLSGPIKVGEPGKRAVKGVVLLATVTPAKPKPTKPRRIGWED